jgi:predicted AlkP superfamily pyrophosphatase or phosphodiesterase
MQNVKANQIRRTKRNNFVTFSLFPKIIFADMRTFLVITFSVFFGSVYSQPKPEHPKPKENKAPKLIVGIVVDQMRTEYIYRYWNRLGKGGFKRLIAEGFFCRNAHYNYVPTFTGPGHCSIYTGATPSTHGIIANDWFVKETGKSLYCTEDPGVKTIGSASNAGQMSPKNQLSTTLGDELKLATNGKGKVFAVALKDRSSILPAGHAANGAFWFDGSIGGFISSSWYMNDLPEWIKQFNAKQLAKKYLETGWNTLYPIESYTNSLPDDNTYEKAPNKKDKPVFPYDYKSYIEKNSYEIIKSTPYGNNITTDIALECLFAEKLGTDDITDMLCISYSSTDLIAHSYGPRAVEVEDTYLRLDSELEKLLNTLDKEVGKDNYSLFLTADHGGAETPNYLKDQKIPAGYIYDANIGRELKQFCSRQYGDSLVRNVSNQQVFLNEEKIWSMKLTVDEVEKTLAAYLIKINGVAEAYPSYELKYQNFSEESFAILIKRGYNFKRSGNVAYSYQPGWLEHEQTGTTHGSAYAYDTHVPVLFFGKGIKKGETVKKVYITQIAPTISFLANINLPNGSTSKPLDEVLKSEKKDKSKAKKKPGSKDDDSD